MTSSNLGAPATSDPIAKDIFVARQPILTAQERVHGYEMLFRDTRQARACTESSDACTRTMLNHCMNGFGLDTLVGPHRAYINITRSVLVEDDYTLLPADRVVIELLEDIRVDGEVIAATRRLKEAGYVLALDDFVFDPSYEPLMALADVIKVDFQASDPKTCATLVRRHARKGLAFLAEKVETHQQHEQALRFGYSLFQGYYFKRPQMVEGRELTSTQRTHLRLLTEAGRDEPDLNTLSQILQSDPTLSVKLLRYLNSAGVGLGHKVHSVRHAVMLMGARPLRKWAAMVAVSCMGQDKPVELMRLSLTRARFCELACAEMNQADHVFDFFMLGLVSSLDAVLDQPMEQVLGLLPLNEPVKDALRGGDAPLGTLYRLMLTCEAGDWDRACRLADWLPVKPARLVKVHNQSRQWADQFIDACR